RARQLHRLDGPRVARPAHRLRQPRWHATAVEPDPRPATLGARVRVGAAGTKRSRSGRGRRRILARWPHVRRWRLRRPARNPRHPKKAEQTRAINLLGSENPVAARHAVSDLANDTGPVVAALAPRIKPAQPGDEQDLEKWIAQLASSRYAERQRATQELERAG